LLSGTTIWYCWSCPRVGVPLVASNRSTIATPWLGQYLALQLGRREGIAVDDEHVELTWYARWRWSRWTGVTPRRHIGRETAARQGESLGLARERLLELRALLHATSLREREWNRADGDK